MPDSPRSRLADLRRPLCAHCGRRAAEAGTGAEARVEVVLLPATSLPVLLCPACRTLGMGSDRVHLCRDCIDGGVTGTPHQG
jgi:hypothetical protein